MKYVYMSMGNFVVCDSILGCKDKTAFVTLMNVKSWITFNGEKVVPYEPENMEFSSNLILAVFDTPEEAVAFLTPKNKRITNSTKQAVMQELI